jgi:transposase InsO family protein
MSAGAFCTSASRLIPWRNGLRNNSAMPSRGTAPEYLLRDRDGIFGEAFTGQIRKMGIKPVLSAPRAPWQRAYVERVIRTLRRDCLDHVIVINEAALRQILRSYVNYYHHSRTHLSLDKDAP